MPQSYRQPMDTSKELPPESALLALEVRKSLCFTGYDTRVQFLSTVMVSCR